ncbi:hypothetical protein [Mariniblastus fucicola]|uniref:Uncharacterized protein n=1 Tax=Mariniblastus fucicola TaxID=980251 RepID=A0A5B9PCJ1_9BACT|nr:hypothetical protein [Mariniblastus fucicola]QEG22632.1 hypothetical protein MFFC18_25150 [Mariniblastus fucicola]
MDFNFFNWIRTSVRNAVLSGVNDAVEAIGTPTDDAEVKNHLAGMINEISTGSLPAAPRRSGRKKLGKSLAQASAKS